MEGDFRFSGLRLADRDDAIGDLRLRASGTFDGAAGVARLTLGQARGGALDVSAQVPVDPRKDWRVGVQARRLDLSFLPALAPAIQELKALLNGGVLISGTRERPRVAGRMRVDGGALRLIDSSLSYHDLLVDLSAKEDGSAQAQVAVKSKGGSVATASRCSPGGARTAGCGPRSAPPWPGWCRRGSTARSRPATCRSRTAA
jgi:autotransporter translocation and assembly factor TamB